MVDTTRDFMGGIQEQPRMDVRLGDILTQHGVLTADQVTTVLDEQRRTHEPFGVICERLLDVSPDAIEHAWATQYVAMTRKVDPATELFDESVNQVVSRRQAWQFRVLPIRYDGDELMMATTARHLTRALRFATRFIGVPVYFVITEPRALGEALCRRYPIAGMTPASINDESLDRLLSMVRSAA
jgi:hypothetical protein